jgi:hypothetical protein
MASINEKLTRINESVSNLKEELKLDKTAEIEKIQQTLSTRKEIIIDEQDGDGYAIAITVKGFDKIPDVAFGTRDGYIVTTDSHIGSFLCSKALKKVNIPEGVTEIGYCAFAGCIVEEVNLPETLTRLGTNAFYQCRQLYSIKRIPDSVT